MIHLIVSMFSIIVFTSSDLCSFWQRWELYPLALEQVKPTKDGYVPPNLPLRERGGI